MSYIGDFRLGDTFDTKFCTVSTTGAPTQLAGTPVISAYVGNSLTQITAGITLTVDFDTVTGLNNVRVVATSGNGYATASNYQLVITTGTVGGTSVVGYVVAEFSIENRSAVMPTTAARTLDISAGGEAGIDWANVGTPSNATNLSATTVNLTNTVTTYTGNTVQTGDSFARLGAPAGASVSADIAVIEAQTDDIGVAGAGLTALGDTRIANLDATVSSRMATYTQPTGFLTATFPTTVASTTNITSASGVVLSAIGSAALTEGYAADGAAPTLNQMLYQIWSALSEFSIASTTITTKKLDGTTTAMTFTLDDATNPTSRTRAT